MILFASVCKCLSCSFRWICTTLPWFVLSESICCYFSMMWFTKWKQRSHFLSFFFIFYFFQPACEVGIVTVFLIKYTGDFARMYCERSEMCKLRLFKSQSLVFLVCFFPVCAISHQTCSRNISFIPEVVFKVFSNSHWMFFLWIRRGG